jgi:hypothetical protein
VQKLNHIILISLVRVSQTRWPGIFLLGRVISGIWASCSKIGYEIDEQHTLNHAKSMANLFLNQTKQVTCSLQFIDIGKMADLRRNS